MEEELHRDLEEIMADLEEIQSEEAVIIPPKKRKTKKIDPKLKWKKRDQEGFLVYERRKPKTDRSRRPLASTIASASNSQEVELGTASTPEVSTTEHQFENVDAQRIIGSMLKYMQPTQGQEEQPSTSSCSQEHQPPTSSDSATAPSPDMDELDSGFDITSLDKSNMSSVSVRSSSERDPFLNSRQTYQLALKVASLERQLDAKTQCSSPLLCVCSEVQLMVSELNNKLEELYCQLETQFQERRR